MTETPWGYQIEKLPPLMSVAEFSAYTGGVMASSSERVAAVLNSVSSAIRDYCGWHVAPSLECKFKGNADGRLFMLPAMGVTEVSAVAVRDELLPELQYEWTTAGMIRLVHGCFPSAWRSVEATYKAGFDSAALAAVVAQVASNTLTASAGVADERAGNVSISYNKTGDGITGGVSLLSRDKELLAAYKLARVR